MFFPIKDYILKTVNLAFFAPPHFAGDFSAYALVIFP
jgi:hypothetical protein